MIEVDSKAIKQYVYFPASIKSEVNQYSLEIHSELSQVTNTYTGLTDESNSRTYFKFLLDLSQEDDGEKNYTIKDELEQVVGSGLIRIGAIEDEMPEEVSYVPEEEIKIIQYNPNNKFEYRFQTNKQVTVTSNDVYVIKPDSGYDALLKATVEVNVPVQDYYNSGYTSGYTDGVEEQKSKLVSTAVTENGVYSRVDGYSSIDVNVPSGSTINNQTKNVTYTANTATTITFDSGYTGLQQVGINVNVAQTGYTQEDLNNAFSNGFNSGFTSGQTVGYNSGYTAGYASGSTDGYDAGYIAGYADGYEDGSHDYEKQYLTITSLSAGSIVLKDIYSNSPISISYSINGGEWQTLTSSAGTGSSFNVNAQDVVRLKGTNSSYNNHYLFTTSAATVEGNIMSMFYGDDFYGEKSFTAASACSALFYYSKFTSAEHLVLPATGLTNSCYENMFIGNASLVNAPKVLPAEIMKKNCYQNMFGECSSLTGSPILHATTLEENCFTSMFKNCRNLTKAPELPCETLAPWCYSNMFSGCQELVNVPDLPASALTMGCYYEMFSGCRSLVTAPELVAATVPMNGYSGMFSYCSSLNKITCLATDISAMNATNNWVNGVSSAGTFTKDVNMASWTTGNNGIPTNWTVKNHGEHDYSQDYLTIEVISGTTNYGLYLGLDRNSEFGATIEYSKNGGEWITATFGTSSTLTNYLPIETGDVFRFRNINSNPSSTNFYNIGCNNYDVNLKVYGNIMSLVDGDNFTTLFALTKSYQFTRLFERNYALRDASNLVLPATLLTSSCYYGLFLGCQQLTAVPVLPATTLSSGCYGNMFQGCTGLINAPELPATTLAEGCYRSMFQACSGLISAPELPATTLTHSCYYQMFYNCSNLKYVKCLAEENGYGTGGWLENVSPNGTFVKKSGSTWTTGISGIPSGWVIQEV